jgi:hypothetical protein
MELSPSGGAANSAATQEYSIYIDTVISKRDVCVRLEAGIILR